MVELVGIGEFCSVDVLLSSGRLFCQMEGQQKVYQLSPFCPLDVERKGY